jgi:drug/metabolite transporter (DMT)-like permease
VIWGTTFVAVKSALGDVSPLLFVAVRFTVATVAALPLLWLSRDRITDQGRPASETASSRRSIHRSALLAGIPLGLVLAGAYAAQTTGLTTTTPTRSAFITGLNVALVPVWALLVIRRKPGWVPILGLALTLPGLWLLTSPEGGSWRIGDTWTLICAVLYALYIVLLGLFGASRSAARLLVSQLGATAVFALIGSLALERPHLHLTAQLAGVLALTAILATTGTTWLQVRLQHQVGPARAAVIYATEPLFAALFSRVFTSEVLSARAWAGGGIILAGMLLSEIGSARVRLHHQDRQPEG